MDAFSVASLFMEVLIAVLAATGNGVVLYLIARHHQLRTITNAFIANLAAADCLVGLLGIPCVLVTTFGLPHNFYGCLLMNCMIIILTQVSIFSLLTVATDRFLAIRHPFWYQEHVTARLVGIASGVCWALGIAVGLVPFFGWNLGWNEQNECNFILIIDFTYRVYFNYFGFILTPLLLMLAIYIYIFQIVRKQANQIAALQVGGVPNDAGGQATNVKREMKAAKRFALIIGLFALSWIPLETMNTISLLTGRTCYHCVIVAVWLSHANSAINPVLYAYGNRPLRQAFLKNFGCKSDIDDFGESTVQSTQKY